MYYHNARTQMNIDFKAAGEVVIVLSENASWTDLRLRLERVYQWRTQDFLMGGGSVTSHRDDESFCDVTAIIMP